MKFKRIKDKLYKGVAVEKWTWSQKEEVYTWLEKNFGEKGSRWSEEHDYDLVDLVMEEEVYVWYLLRWT